MSTSESTTMSDLQVIQAISFTILNDSTFDKRFTAEGRRWSKAMEIIKQQKGWLRTFYGQDMNSFHKIDLYIVWMNTAVAEAFTSTPTFEATLAGVAVSSLSNYYIELQGTMSSYGPIEIITLSFPSTLSEQDQFLFNEQLGHCKIPGPQMVHGWTMKPGRMASNASRDCAVVFKWDSLDEMYDVKSDQESVFNNGFVPLRNEASEGSKTALYTKLRDDDRDRSKCIVM